MTDDEADRERADRAMLQKQLIASYDAVAHREYMMVIADMHRISFLAYTAAGFSVDEALKLCRG